MKPKETRVVVVADDAAGVVAHRLLLAAVFSALTLFLMALFGSSALAAPATTTTTLGGPAATAQNPATTVITAPLNATAEEQRQVLDEARRAAEQVNDQVRQIQDLSDRVPGGLSVADEARQRAAEVQRRLDEMQSISDQITDRQSQVLRASAELDIMDEELAAVVEEYNLRVIELEEARYEADRMAEELTLVQQQLENLNQALEDRVLGTYKNRASALEILAGTTDLKDFVKRVTLMVSVAHDDRDRVDEIEALRARVDRLLDEVSRRMYEVTVASQELEAQRIVIETKMAERESFIERLSAEIRDLVDEQRDLARNIVPEGLDLAAYLTGDGSTVVKTALKYLGVPYVWGGETPSGFDCSGLVLYVFRQHGVFLPHYSRYQATMGYAVPRGMAQAGDLVFFGAPVHHVGIYMGDDMFVHAPRTGDVVKISRLSARNDLTHVRRFTFGPTTPVVDTPQPAEGQPAATPLG